MRFFISLTITFFCFLCTSAFLCTNAFSVTNSSLFLSTQYLKRGMVLQGKTRMAGNVMTSFDLVILSVMKGRAPQDDAILAQIQTASFEETGVLAGMSGSPVYHQGKLVGAVAFTMTFMKKPIVGITPIHAMLRLLEYAEKNNADPYIESSTMYGLKPIATPLGVRGTFHLKEQTVKTILGRDDFLLVPMGMNSTDLSVGGAAKAVNMAPAFEPGDAIGVSLVSGDMSISALGTVTYVTNDRVLAFGHPFGELGKVNFPLHQAEVDAVIPMMSLSFKVGKLGPEVGAIIEDRSPAILGVVGRKANKVPFYISFKSPLQTKKFTYFVTADKNYFSSLVAMLSLNSLVHFESISEEATFFYDMKLDTDYHNKSVRITDVISTKKTLIGGLEIASHLREVIRYIENNDFLPVKIKQVELDVSVASKLDYYHLIEAIPQRKRYRPGEKVHLIVTFKNYRRGLMTREIVFPLPKDIKDGNYPVMLTSGTYFLSLDFSLNRSKYIARHPDRLFEILNENINGQTLSVFMFDPNRDVMVGGHKYQDLPQFIIDSLVRSRSQDKSILIDFYRRDFQMPSVVMGAVKLGIRIEQDIYEGEE